MLRAGLYGTDFRAGYVAAESTRADVAYRISLRYMSGITPKMQVNYGSRLFDILAAINVNERNREPRTPG
jgi:head-tail adaptor